MIFVAKDFFDTVALPVSLSCFFFSTGHGTFVGKRRLEPYQPVFIEEGGIFHFGASTRRYILRGRLELADEDEEGNKDMLPQEHELEVLNIFFNILVISHYFVLVQNLTEYNTALNRRIPIIPISLEDARRKKRQRGNVAFLEEETIINPGKLLC